MIKAAPIEFEGVDEATILALEELARAEWLNESLKAQIEQEEFARHCRNVDFKAVDGIGQVTRQVHAFAFHDWAAKEGSYDVWKDKSFNRYFDRIAPETKVKCVAPKSGNGLALQVGWTPGPDTAPKRFSKKYDLTSPKADTSPRPSPLEAEREKMAEVAA
jgi:hypothetical protein